jgi:hypothetical protein
MEKMLLRDPDFFPSKEVLQAALGNGYSVFEEFETLLTNELHFTLDWCYYKDSKGWLCKVSYKKKTVFWLSIWEGFFKTSFFLLERHLEGIAALEIDDKRFILEKECGKMLPFIFNIKNKKQLPDVVKMARFKMQAK